MISRDLELPTELRAKLKVPQGQLIKGSIEETVPILVKLLMDHKDIIAGVGDVTSELLIDNNIKPNLVITDGQTKRNKLQLWREFKDYKILKANCPAARITLDAWKAIKLAVNQIEHNNKIHLKINGEEDLLVLPLILELPIGSKIIYGQPNVGAVIRAVTPETINFAKDIINNMDKI